MSRENKAAIVVLSDPQGGEEALGRLFNALAVAYDFDQDGRGVRLQFQGAGSRWPKALSAPDHPAYELYQTVRHTVTGVSCGCAQVFGASDGVAASGLELLTDNAVPGTGGLPSLRALTDEGYTILSF